MSREMYYMEKGQRCDAALHDYILDNPKADRALSARAIERGIAMGVTRKQAELLFGIRDEADPK